jgi:DNA repair protein SbcC/Rad50
MIESIQLRNWKSHTESNFQFQPGTNVLVGSMGAGKSSILQAISFALFGTFSELKHRNIKSSDVISRSAEQKIAEVTLSIKSPKNKAFQIKRKIDAKKNIAEGTVRDAEGKLVAGPQTTQVNDFVKKELGVDDEIFLRTVYAMQNDIDMILKLAPKERKKRIDELMGLNKFEVARNNCISRRNKLVRQKVESESFLQSIGLEDINKKIEDADSQVESLKSKQIGFKLELSRKKTEKDNLRVNLLDLREKLEESNRLEERKRAILKQVSELNEKLKDTNSALNQQDIDKEIEDTKVKIRAIQGSKTRLSEEQNQVQLKFMTSDKKIALAENKLKLNNEKLEKVHALKLELAKQRISDLGAEISELKKEIDGKKDAKQANLAELRNLREHLEKLTLASSQCPICNNALNEESKSQIVTRRKSEISQILYSNTEISEILNKLEYRYNELSNISEKNRYALEELGKESELVQEAKYLLLELDENKKVILESQSYLEHTKNQIKNMEAEMELLSSKLSTLNDQRYIHDLKLQLSQANAELQLVDEDLRRKKVSKPDVEKLEEQFQQSIRYVQELETTISNFESLLIEKVKNLAELKNQQNRATELQSRISELESQTGLLDRFKKALEATQLALRDELILAVNEVMSQVWVEIYPYDKWSGVRLSSTEQDYTLQIKEAEGDWVPVAGFASGGERMLASLAVRIAFARVLAPALSLLILDEPTHNLDEKAVTTFIDVIQNRVSDFLDQIFIVTHEEKLAENADNVVRI